ncbi:helix-turn-helix domain-containing protein [Actinomadura fibrosa]|uniref:Scr1 family TA system antitoxin-like transcriptional regulator n=1 Tax=Actinomadura fibrosa TaxID=111802 RepID=A0ABW2Y1Z7_9ACTN|nr:helix-turn-helix transcriptional regulator [Actinomadura fibrosa]
MVTRKPTPHTLAFGVEVARVRQDRALTRLELAKLVTCSRSYIAQVELGTTRCREDFAGRLDKAMDCAPTLADAWDDLLRSAAYPKYFSDYPKAESTAALLRAFELTAVFGLFQIEAYMHALLDSEQAVEARLKRQAILKRQNPPQVSVVLSEPILYADVGGASLMKAQCERLIEVARMPNVALQIAPTGRYWELDGSFNLASQSTGEELLYMCNARGGVTTDDPSDILYIVSQFSSIQAHAMNADESIECIRKAVVRWS